MFLSRIIENIRKGDLLIWGIIASLSVISLAVVYSSTQSLAFRRHDGNTEFYLVKHLSVLTLGLVIAYIVQEIDHRYFSKAAKIMLLLSVIMLIYTLQFGSEVNDAKRWISIPIINLSFQTSDFAKLALIMYTSRTLAVKQGKVTDFWGGFVPIMAPIGIICGLIMLENMSTALILFVTNLIIMFLGRVSMKYILTTILFGLVVFSGIVAYSYHTGGRFSTWIGRIERFMDSKSENVDYQVMNSNIAIANGGWIRFNPGGCTQCNFLPEAYSDFIFSTIVEEYGLVGGAFVIFLYLLLLYRVIKIVQESNRIFSALMALGLGMSLVIQAFINMGVAVNLLPVTGLTLPFLSMGGTSIWFNGIAIGIILSVSKYVKNYDDTQNKNYQPKMELNV
ncbi:MAG: FtsW/RodA/SpoVE family cell cycle protein [Chitinophagales bacterium]|nr:FtsW/RodA/SpoVE family cell cycle protein [Chitinophagales bacterium]